LKKEAKRNNSYFVSDAISEDIIEDNQVFLDKNLQQLYNGIKQLPEIDRAIILLYLEERPYKEIAKIIGTNTNNIGVKIKRIKERLKIILTK
jgi:RNA polymerase sigma-70 factor (ECF subfamily)